MSTLIVRSPSRQRSEFWLLLAIRDQEVLVAGFDETHEATRKKGKARRKELQYKYFGCFDLTDPFLGEEIFSWLTNYGIASDEAKQLVRELGHQLGEVLNVPGAANPLRSRA